MHRRRFLKTAAGTGAVFAADLPACSGEPPAAEPADAPRLPAPTPAQVAWQDDEIGLIYHFDMPIAAGRFAGNNTVRETLDPALYNPVRLDTDQWIEAAKAAGARYAIFTATHFNGFMQWQSDLYPYGVKQARWRDGKGDVVGDFVASCRKAGIRPGIYFSTHRNVYWRVWGHYVDWGKGRGTEKQAAFNRVAEQMTGELCSRYGPLAQIWYDAGVKTPAEGGPDVLPVFERHQPDSVFYHNRQRSDIRWIGNEKGHAGYPCWATMPGSRGAVSHNHPTWRPILAAGDPDGTIWSPGMVDVPFRGAKGVHNWFWKPGQDHAIESVDRLMAMYHHAVGRNANLVVGEVVTSEGRVPEPDIARLAAFGREVRRRYGTPLAETRGEGETVELALPAPRRIDRVVMMEEIARGERVRAYVLEGLAGPDRWERLAAGTCIGHKRIETFDAVEAARVRLRVTAAVAPPRIRRLAAFEA
jgi:alpha-L-fucosidase